MEIQAGSYFQTDRFDKPDVYVVEIECVEQVLTCDGGSQLSTFEHQFARVVELGVEGRVIGHRQVAVSGLARELSAFDYHREAPPGTLTRTEEWESWDDDLRTRLGDAFPSLAQFELDPDALWWTGMIHGLKGPHAIRLTPTPRGRLAFEVDPRLSDDETPSNWETIGSYPPEDLEEGLEAMRSALPDTVP